MKRWVICLIVLTLCACATTPTSTPASLFVTPQAPVITPLGEPLSLNVESAAADPGLAVSSQGLPVLVWLEGSDLVAWSWNGDSWTQMGDKPLNTQPDTVAAQPDVTASEDGRIAVTWRECCNPDGNLYVAEWNGSIWQMLGAELDVYGVDLDQPNPKIVHTPDGLVVAWRERDVKHNTHQVLIRRWDGSVWQPLGSSETLNEDPAKAAQQISLTTLPNGAPVLMWSEWDGLSAPSVNVRAWNAEKSDWDTLPPPVSELDESMGTLSLDITADDHAFVALDAQNGPLVETMAVTDDSWHTIGFPVELKDDQHSCVAAPTLIADETSSILMVWGDTCQTAIRVSDWNGSTWTTTDLTRNNQQYEYDDYAAAASTNGTVYIAWLEDVQGIAQVRVASYGLN